MFSRHSKNLYSTLICNCKPSLTVPGISSCSEISTQMAYQYHLLIGVLLQFIIKWMTISLPIILLSNHLLPSLVSVDGAPPRPAAAAARAAAAPPASSSSFVERLNLKKIDGYRRINWGITGLDEPLLHSWPFNQFIPILQRNLYYPPANPGFRYRLEFNEIYSRVPGVGRTTVNCQGYQDSPWCPDESNATLGPIPYKCDTNRENCQYPKKNFTALKVHSKLYKTVHVILYGEKKRNASLGITDTWIPAELEGVLLQGNHNPLGVGIPTGEFYLDEEYNCVDCPLSNYGVIIPARKRSVIEVVHPTILGFHHEMQWLDIDEKFYQAGKRSEVHANFRWYSVPCSETKRLQFTLLAVHSFKENIYDIIELGPYEVRYTAQANHSDIIPSPIFYPLFYHNHLAGTWCHAANAPDIQSVRTPTIPFPKFDFSHSYDSCVRNETNPRKKEIGEVKEKIESFFCSDPEQPICPFWEPTIRPKLESTFSDLSMSPCPEPCPTPEPIIQPAVVERPYRIFKRGVHGSILIMTNFCIMPINTFIARFYKETFNVTKIKGLQMWVWMHLLGSMISCTFIYVGTFTYGPDMNDTLHVYLGKVYIILLAICYFTAWGRHSNHWCNVTLEFVHGCLGYTTIIMAHVTMHTSPNTGHIPKILVDFQIMLHALFMLVLTSDICYQDNAKFGMRPNRRHFPTVEARFDDIEIPNHSFRIVLLIILSVVTFGCSFASSFFE